MTKDFVAELLRATGSLRPGEPVDVGAVIENALAAAGLTVPASAPLAGAMPQPRGERVRRPLSEVVESLRAGLPGALPVGGLPGLRPATPEVPVPDGAQFLELRHAGPHGARRYRLYVPASAAGGLEGLVVMLHGCTQGPEDFALGTGMNAVAEARRLLVLYPGQAAGDNSMCCWNWFRPGDQARGYGEPALLAGLTEAVRDAHAIPRQRVFVAGLSAGGAMAAVLGATYPDVYAAIGVHSGIAHGSASDVASAFAAMRGQPGPAARPGSEPAGPRAIIFHGTADATVHPSNASRIADRHATGTPVRTERLDGNGRRVTRLVSQTGDGLSGVECWMVEDAGHAWSGGDPHGSYTDPRGPDASAEMTRFFLEHYAIATTT